MEKIKNIYRWAGIYGLIVLLPGFFFEQKVGIDNPPPITHPEFYYGFLGVTIPFQILFLFISKDPVRYRPIMPVCVLEKFIPSAATITLYLMGRVSLTPLLFSFVDVILGTLFLVAYLSLKNEKKDAQIGF